MVKVDAECCSNATLDLARQLYAAYTANSDNLNYRGDQCPTWDGLTPAVRSHWCAVALCADSRLETPRG